MHHQNPRRLDYSICQDSSPEKLVWVRDVPTEVVWIDGDDDEPLDAIVMRCIPTAKRFVDAAIAAGLISKNDVLRGHVIVSVDRTNSVACRGDVNVETYTDLFTFTPEDRGLSAGPQYGPVAIPDFLEDIESPSKKQVRLLRDLVLAEESRAG